MTDLYSTSPVLDLSTLDGVIVKHVQAYARRVGGLAERYAMNMTESSSCVSLFLIDPDQDLFVGRAEAIFAGRLYTHGFDAALALAAVTSRSPFNPNEAAIAAVLGQTRYRILETVQSERSKWELPA